MRRILYIGLTALGIMALMVGGYETVNTIESYPYLDVVQRQKRRLGFDYIPDALVMAFIDGESSFDPEAVRMEFPDTEEGRLLYADASVGLMQVLFSTAQGLGFKGAIWDLQEPDTGVEYGLKVLNQYYGFLQDWDKVIHAYNEGIGNYRKGKRVPLYYAKIKARWEKWSLLLSGGEISG